MGATFFELYGVAAAVFGLLMAATLTVGVISYIDGRRQILKAIAEDARLKSRRDELDRQILREIGAAGEWSARNTLRPSVGLRAPRQTALYTVH